ncbi:MAG: hypothetical protein CM15mP120_26360 [Pseudomonadota bacterium]|nr:MAG: hypothetical protein CM15mP120_26360 [Pseudomonadota bacterium]
MGGNLDASAQLARYAKTPHFGNINKGFALTADELLSSETPVGLCHIAEFFKNYDCGCFQRPKSLPLVLSRKGSQIDGHPPGTYRLDGGLLHDHRHQFPDLSYRGLPLTVTHWRTTGWKPRGDLSC